NALCLSFVFFFSSRRRHTRFSRDWSSDVCSSDLVAFFNVAVVAANGTATAGYANQYGVTQLDPSGTLPAGIAEVHALKLVRYGRSEERRVGKECRAGWRS